MPMLIRERPAAVLKRAVIMSDNPKFITQAKEQDPQAIADIYGQYRATLLDLAVRHCHDAHAAEDILQDVFVSLMICIPKLTVRKSLLAYLKASVLNRVRDRYRRKARTRVVTSQTDHTASPIDPEKQAILKEQIAHLQQSLMALPENQRDVLMWRVYGGHSFKRISQLQATPCGTARARYRYGTSKLAVLCSQVI